MKSEEIKVTLYELVHALYQAGLDFKTAEAVIWYLTKEKENKDADKRED